jgi:hypothetical protein
MGFLGNVKRESLRGVIELNDEKEIFNPSIRKIDDKWVEIDLNIHSNKSNIRRIMKCSEKTDRVMRNFLMKR